jgi:hypothetical protein
MGVGTEIPPLTGWTPVRVDWEDEPSSVRWVFTDGIEFTEPFFIETVRRARDDPFRLLFWRATDVDALVELAERSAGIEPVGVIFHLSRSGSTLVSQMLAGLPSTLVLSEPPHVDQVLRALFHPGITDDRVVSVLGALGAAFGQAPRPGQTCLILKLDAWAIRHWRVVRAAFPKAACIFVYRDPVDVLLSHLDHRGMHMVPGALPPQLLGIDDDQPPTSWEDYGAAVLAGLCTSALEAAQSEAVELVAHADLPDAVANVIAPRFGVPIGPAERDVFAGIARRDAKNPVIPFETIAGERRRRAPRAVVEAATERVGPLFEALETIRIDRGARA